MPGRAVEAHPFIGLKMVGMFTLVLTQLCFTNRVVLEITPYSTQRLLFS
jgi:hypothetical protein